MLCVMCNELELELGLKQLVAFGLQLHSVCSSRKTA